MRGQSNNSNILNYNRSLKSNYEICGIRNIGNNCYLNSGLQILASCTELVNELQKSSYKSFGQNIISLLNDAFENLLCKIEYNPENLIKFFCKINYDFSVGSQCCSQNFIRTLIGNINDCSQKIINTNFQYQPIKENELKGYKKYIESNKIYPESKAQSLFSGMTKSYSKGKCPFCGIPIENYSFNYFIDQSIYLDDFDYYEYIFLDILRGNYNNYIDLTMDCPGCNEEIKIKEETKIIKLPDILIFTLERYQGEKKNKIIIKPDKKLNMNEFIDKNVKVDSTEYELFAINIRFGSTANFGHEICQVMRNGKWYQINDSYGNKINDISYFDSSYGLFYRKIKNKDKDNKYRIKEVNENIIPLKTKDDINIIQNKNDNKKITSNITENINLKINIDNNKEYGIQNIHLVKEVIFEKIKNEKNIHNFIQNLNKAYFYLKQSELSQKKIDSLINELKNFGEKIIKKNLYDKNKRNKEYQNYINNYKVYPQTKAYSLYSLMIKRNSSGKCYKCYNNYNMDFNSYSNMVDFCLDLPKKKNANFKMKNILKFNFPKKEPKTLKCNNGHFYNSYQTISIINLPEILIFTLNRDNSDRIQIEPDDIIEMYDYLDTQYNEIKGKYKLFAINYLKNNNLEYKCQIYRNGKWFEIDDDNDPKEIGNPKGSIHSIGLFYGRI